MYLDGARVEHENPTFKAIAFCVTATGEPDGRSSGWTFVRRGGLLDIFTMSKIDVLVAKR